MEDRKDENNMSAEEAEAQTIRVERGATTEGLPVAPSMSAAINQLHIPARPSLMDARAVQIVGLAVILGIAAGFIAEFLRRLIGLVTNIAFYGRLSIAEASPADAVPHLGWWVVGIPVIGGIIVGIMARYGSRGIRGHGIPEAMEQVLTNESRIAARLIWLKPLSAAIAIGTGGPFGAEGPIIATGGALGSGDRTAGGSSIVHGAKNPARRRRRSGNGGDLWQPGIGRPARRRVVAV